MLIYYFVDIILVGKSRFSEFKQIGLANETHKKTRGFSEDNNA